MNNLVFHKIYGQCSVIADQGETVVIRANDNKIYEVLKSEVNATGNEEYSYRRAILRLQSALISSINNTWGIFNRTKINLLPHQLWVCNKVMSHWPTRMMVADDVGLGKTIEAGLILMSAIASEKAKRILILTPANLVKNWKNKLQDLFGLSFTIYTSDSGKKNPDWFDKTHHAIVSIPTLVENQQRIDNFLESDPWDLVFVDEAHHIGTRGNSTTRGFKLFRKLDENGKIASAVFFTATPHQGINNDFWNLMSLLDGVFCSGVPTDEKYAALNKYMIRNNKSNVIDMKGNKLFKKLTQHQVTFSYTPEEASFYELMSEFISKGYAYASNSDNEDLKNRRKLVLMSLQKIATSSVAAIRSAIKSRIITLKTDIHDTDENISEEENSANDDISLMENEIFYLQELLESASYVKKESRIDKVLEVIEKEYPDQSILLFTEYKKTQRLVVEALMRKYGEDNVDFINGDNALEVFNHTITIDRATVEEDFNTGNKRFLVSTEASSEGIDLQKHCHVLIHIDLPWNPMRMQQRVGRIYRYGQTDDVDVVTIRNPETIESDIWFKLEVKLRNVMTAFGKVMEDPEDLLMMVIGMQDPAFFDSILAEGQMHTDDFDSWFDLKTKTFGSVDAFDFIQSMVSNAASFDLSELMRIPDITLERLRPFMKALLHENKITVSEDDNKLISFKVPKDWMELRKTSGGNFKMPFRVVAENLSFDRDIEDVKKICGVGSAYVDLALVQAYRYCNDFAYITGDSDYLVIRVYERLTNIRSSVSSTFIGYKIHGKSVEKLNDQELFLLSEKWLSAKKIIKEDKHLDPAPELLRELLERSKVDYKTKGVEFSIPDSEFFMYLVGEKH